jgi:anaerobic dimethyl sulfoxide reductase subunit C (anchor subunit)
MNLHDFPMVLFTVVSQLSVGTFLTLGVIQFAAARRQRSAETVDRVVTPVLYAIGPALVLGLAVSMLHMNDVTNVFNVIRHWDSSWLSREILFGVSFAAFGFLFAILEWFKIGSRGLRQVIAVITGLLGIGLVIAEAGVYYSLVAVPAWHTWVVPFQFFGTTILLGVLAAGAALMVTTAVRLREPKRADGPVADADETGDEPVSASRVASDDATDGPVDGSEGSQPSGGLMVKVRTRVREINAPATDEEWTLTASVLRGVAFVGALTAVALLVVYPVYIAILTQSGLAGQMSVDLLIGPAFWIRLILLGTTAILLGFFVYRMAGTATLKSAKNLATIVVVTFLLALIGEFIGRALHYAIMVRVGI